MKGKPMTTQTAHDTHDHTKVNITINDVHYQVETATMTGSQLKVLAGIADANQLFLEEHGPGDDLQVLNDTSVELKSGMKFFDVPVGNLGAR